MDEKTTEVPNFEYPPAVLRRLLGLTLVGLSGIVLSREDVLWQLPVAAPLLGCGFLLSLWPLKAVLLSDHGVLVKSWVRERWFGFRGIEKMETTRSYLGVYRTVVSSKTGQFTLSSSMSDYGFAVSEIFRRCPESESDEPTKQLTERGSVLAQRIKRNSQTVLWICSAMLLCCFLAVSVALVAIVANMLQRL